MARTPPPATVSEALFRRFCNDHGIQCRRIPAATGRTPDFGIRVRGRRIIVETKQFEPNREDLESIANINAGRVAARSYPVGTRIRNAISHGKRQLSRLSKGKCPALLVIYNNIPLCSAHTDPMMVLVAMYGQIEVPVVVPTNKGQQPRFLTARRGGNRGVSPAYNTSLSAVGVLQTWPQECPGLTLYHNIHAAVPFEPDWLRSDVVRHYTVTDASQFTNWVEA